MTNRLKIKFGSLEFEYEGELDFTQEAIKDLFSHMESLFAASGAAEQPSGGAEPTGSNANPTTDSPPSMHVNTVAAKLDVKTGPDLAIAATAALQLIQGFSSVTRQQILDEMKSATSYYQANMSGNLTKILKTLVTNHKLNQIGTSSYSLHANERKSLEPKLAE